MTVLRAHARSGSRYRGPNRHVNFRHSLSNKPETVTFLAKLSDKFTDIELFQIKNAQKQSEERNIKE